MPVQLVHFHIWMDGYGWMKVSESSSISGSFVFIIVTQQAVSSHIRAAAAAAGDDDDDG